MSKDSPAAKELEALTQAYNRIPDLVWQDLWRNFGGISYAENPHTTSYKEGRRQVLFYMLGMAGKLDFSEMEVIWKQVKARKPVSKPAAKGK